MPPPSPAPEHGLKSPLVVDTLVTGRENCCSTPESLGPRAPRMGWVHSVLVLRSSASSSECIFRSCRTASPFSRRATLARNSCSMPGLFEAISKTLLNAGSACRLSHLMSSILQLMVSFCFESHGASPTPPESGPSFLTESTASQLLSTNAEVLIVLIAPKAPWTCSGLTRRASVWVLVTCLDSPAGCHCWTCTISCPASPSIC
mmetsp:Transcript_46544/g.72834  ORF Transcript_46544/g.72834 Transcript_46544/m.72834 type:complete len:204 (-) Transcript_46544:586-1197(-)